MLFLFNEILRWIKNTKLSVCHYFSVNSASISAGLDSSGTRSKAPAGKGAEADRKLSLNTDCPVQQHCEAMLIFSMVERGSDMLKVDPSWDGDEAAAPLSTSFSDVGFLLLSPERQRTRGCVLAGWHNENKVRKWKNLQAAICWLVGNSLLCVFSAVEFMSWKHTSAPVYDRRFCRKGIFYFLLRPADPQPFPLRTTLQPSAPLTRTECCARGREGKQVTNLWHLRGCR